MISLLLPVIYLAFISLGLPDALLGAAWPSMYPQLGAGVSWAGGVSMIISVGTIVSSLASDWLNNKLGTGRVTALSVATTAVALFGFSTCTAGSGYFAFDLPMENTRTMYCSAWLYGDDTYQDTLHHIVLAEGTELTLSHYNDMGYTVMFQPSETVYAYK